jgi:peptide/nickel transport system substrate-binding protein
MKNIQRTLALLLCVVMAASLLGAPAAYADDKHVELNIVRNTNNTTTVFSVNPAIQYQGGASVDLGSCETLFVFNDDMSDVEGILATDYSLSDNGLSWTITIRDGVSFSNGKPLTAESVKASIEFVLENIVRFATLLDVESIEADGQTLTIRTNSVVPGLVNYLTDSNFLIFDVEENADLDHHIVGTGAYILESMDDDGNCEMVRNENYWRGMPIAERVHSKCGLDATAVSMALQSGEIDWGGINASDIGLFNDESRYRTISTLSNGRVFYLYLNPNYTFTADPAVREALLYAFDREAILLGVYRGSGSITKVIFPEYSVYYDDSYAHPDFDAEKAKEILAAAGYADSDGDGILEKDGEKLHLNITCYSANSFPVLSEVLQSMLKDIGIESDILVSDAIMDDLGAGEFNIGTYGYNTLTYGDCNNYLDPVYRTGGNSNFVGFSDPVVDADLDALRTETDVTKRAELAKEIQQHIYEAHDHMYLMHVISYTIVSDNIVETVPVFGTNRGTGQFLWSFDKK